MKTLGIVACMAGFAAIGISVLVLAVYFNDKAGPVFLPFISISILIGLISFVSGASAIAIDNVRIQLEQLLENRPTETGNRSAQETQTSESTESISNPPA